MFKVGFSKTVITPPIGVPLAGYAARRGVSIGIHDDLYARCLFLGQGDKRVFIVSLDLIGFDRKISEKLDKILRESGFEREELFLASIHTHSGPDTRGMYSKRDEAWENLLVRKIIGIMNSSELEATEAELRSGIGRVEGVTINRRDPFKGLIDPSVHVVGFGRHILVNFTSHATVLGPSNLYISRDYPGALVDFLEANTQSNVIFLNGACGDVNPRLPGFSLDKPYAMKGGFKDVEWMGRVVGAEALKTLLLARKEEPELDYTQKTIEPKTYPLPSIKEVEERLQLLLEELKRNDTNELRFKIFEAQRTLWFWESFKGKLITEVKALKISKNTAIVFLPGEPVVKIGLTIKSRSPFPNTLVVGYSGDYIGYLPLKEDYEKGGYEAKFPVTFLIPGESEKIMELALELLESLK